MCKKIIIVALSLFILAGCGRKEAPQVIVDAAPPSIASNQYEVKGNILRMDIRLAGGRDGVGYQIDRAEIDPHCQCPNMWRRYFEKYPQAKNADTPLVKMINLLTHKVSFAFRIRAVDGLGRLGPWSKPFQAQAEEFFK